MTKNNDITLICKHCGNRIIATRELFDTAQLGFWCFCNTPLITDRNTLTRNVIVGGKL